MHVMLKMNIFAGILTVFRYSFDPDLLTHIHCGHRSGIESRSRASVIMFCPIMFVIL